MALITIRTATLDAGAAFLEITYDDADLGSPLGPDEEPPANARLVQVRVVNTLPYTIDVSFTDPRNGRARDGRALSERIGAPGDRTLTLPPQRNRRVELRDLREFGFGGQAVA